MARRRSANKGYEKGDRVGELIRRILGDELTELEDERLGLLTISGVEVDNELSLARVYWSSFGGNDAEISEALGEHAGSLRTAVAKRTRLRHTPRLEFHPDPGIRDGARIEEILANVEYTAQDYEPNPETGDD
jgi:ribosome-binding factor A